MRSVLVTGGSRGLGLGITQKLAATGYRVIAVARKKSKDVSAAEAVHGGRAQFNSYPSTLAKSKRFPISSATCARNSVLCSASSIMPQLGTAAH